MLSYRVAVCVFSDMMAPYVLSYRVAVCLLSHRVVVYEISLYMCGRSVTVAVCKRMPMFECK